MLERTVEYHLTTRVRCGLCHSGQKHDLLESARFALKNRLAKVHQQCGCVVQNPPTPQVLFLEHGTITYHCSG